MRDDCSGCVDSRGASHHGTLPDSLRRDLAGSGNSFIVPHLLDVEVASALRKLVAGQRIWELRHNFTAYDAAYIALAEATNSVLYTSDEKLCKGHHARVALFTH
jgi:predicted nucleic acid-binding protein